MTQLVLNAQTPTSKANAVTIMPDESGISTGTS